MGSFLLVSRSIIYNVHLFSEFIFLVDEDGTKIVIYGGCLRNNTIVGELWILNVVTYTWSQAASGPPRSHSACTIAGDQFLIWGGKTDSEVLAPSEMLIYNIAKAEYVTQYTPPAFYKDRLPPPALRRVTAPWPTKTLTSWGDAGSATNGDGKGSSATKEETTSAIVGGVVGGLALLGAFAGIFFLRRRLHLRQVQKSNAGVETDQTGQGGGGCETPGRRLCKNPQCHTTRNDPHATEQDYDHVDRSLQELVEQQRQLEQKRQLLILKQQGLSKNGSNTDCDTSSLHLASGELTRAPAILQGAKTEYQLPSPATATLTPTPTPLQSSRPSFSPDSLYADLLLSTASLTVKPTVHTAPDSVAYNDELAGSNEYADRYEGARL